MIVKPILNERNKKQMANMNKEPIYLEVILKRARKEVRAMPKYVRDAAQIALSEEGYS
jgi:hypothetical protein